MSSPGAEGYHYPIYHWRLWPDIHKDPVLDLRIKGSVLRGDPSRWFSRCKDISEIIELSPASELWLSIAPPEEEDKRPRFHRLLFWRNSEKRKRSLDEQLWLTKRSQPWNRYVSRLQWAYQRNPWLIDIIDQRNHRIWAGEKVIFHRRGSGI